MNDTRRLTLKVPLVHALSRCLEPFLVRNLALAIMMQTVIYITRAANTLSTGRVAGCGLDRLLAGMSGCKGHMAVFATRCSPARYGPPHNYAGHANSFL